MTCAWGFTSSRSPERGLQPSLEYSDYER